ncbi:corticotropin-releasing factor receptor 1-like isoform X3 [Asterias amurensis]|uniref:corticotropin-releasing factor receptor 1-like isoform X3 n=1 Tax=Asterias amurensis TaxID=7602 RepID=UPI003AB83ADB
MDPLLLVWLLAFIMNLGATGAGAQDDMNREYYERVIHERAMDCVRRYQNVTVPGVDPNFSCQFLFDGVLCWPPSAPDTKVEQICPLDSYGVALVQRTCYSNATWEQASPQSLYLSDSCRCVHCLSLAVLSNLGYALSLAACAVAFLIFLCSRTLHCTRNRIHWHLISSFMLKYLVYFAQIALFNTKGLHLTRILDTLLFYFEQTNYFWMFVEGMYLHTLVVFALRIDADKIMFWVYCIIGWGLPMVFVGSWAIVSVALYPDSQFINMSQDAVIVHEYVCIIGPILLVLVINCFFLLNIVRLLMSKLRMQGNRTSDIQHYRRAARATLVLVVLLGVGYILFICLSFLPTDLPPLGNLILKYVNVLLSSTQGLAVSVIYVFLNTEVRTVLRRKWRRRYGSKTPSCLCRKRPKPRTSSYSKYDEQTCTSTMRSMANNDTMGDSCYNDDDVGHRGHYHGNKNANGGGTGKIIANGDTNGMRKIKDETIEMDVVKNNGTAAKWDRTEEGEEVEEAEPLLEEGQPQKTPAATIVISEATPEHETSASKENDTEFNEH